MVTEIKTGCRFFTPKPIEKGMVTISKKPGLNIVTKIIMSLEFITLMKKVENNYNALIERRGSILIEIKTLIKNGVEYGAPSYKANKYLRIVKPMTNGKREFLYIGSDPKKIKKALLSLERGARLKELENEKDEIDKDINYLLFYLKRATFE